MPASPATVKAKTKGHTQNNTAKMLLSIEVNYGKGNTLVNCKHMSNCTANFATAKDTMQRNMHNNRARESTVKEGGKIVKF